MKSYCSIKTTPFKKRLILFTGPEWIICDIVTITGNLVDKTGVHREENVELWRWDPVECVSELMGNPAFKDYMSYILEHVYLDKGGEVWIFDEVWTADWWWNTQVIHFDLDILSIETHHVFIKKALPRGATIAPLILSSDKTQLTQFLLQLQVICYCQQSFTSKIH